MTVPSIDVLLIAARAVFLVFSFLLAAVTFTRWRRATQAQTEQLLAGQAQLVQRLEEIGERIAATAGALSQLSERSPQPLPVPSTAAAPGYQIAIRLARGGASCDELIRSCGLSAHEAELVHRLHSPHSRVGRKAVSREAAA